MENIIFDFDGTLADTALGIMATEEEMLRRLGLPLTSKGQMQSGIGLPLAECLRVGCNVPEDIIDSAVVLYRELFFDYAPQHIVLFDGVRETLDAFKKQGTGMAIATSRGASSLSRILQVQGLSEYFAMYMTADDGIKAKPAPDMVLAILERMGWKSSDTIVVGDTTFDIEMGNGAGCRTVGVTYGNHSKEKLLTAKPYLTVDRFNDIPLTLTSKGEDDIS